MMTSMGRTLLCISGALAAIATVTAPAQAQGQVNLYCSVQVEWCQGIVTSFQKATGITVNGNPLSY